MPAIGKIPRGRTGDADHAFEQGQIGGGEGEDDASTAITRVVGNWNLTRVIGNAETLISAVPCRFGGFVFNTTSAGTVSLRDASATGGGSTPKIIADATRDVFTLGDRFPTGLTVQGSAAGTDVTVRWRPIATGGL